MSMLRTERQGSTTAWFVFINYDWAFRVYIKNSPPSHNANETGEKEGSEPMVISPLTAGVADQSLSVN